MDQRESADKIEPALAAEPIENAEASEPTDPTDRIEPAEPMDRIEPDKPIDRIDPLDPMLKMEPEDPGERGELAEIRITTFWQAGDQPGISSRVLLHDHIAPGIAHRAACARVSAEMSWTWPFFDPRREQAYDLSNAGGAQIRPARGRVDPAQVSLAVELRQRIEECARRRIGRERRGDIIGEITALRAFRGQLDAHLIADRDRHAGQPLRSHGQHPPLAGRHEPGADPAAADCAANGMRGLPDAALSVNEEQIQAHRYLLERELIAVLAEHAEDVAELLHRIRRNGIRVEVHHVVADTAEFIEALDKGHTIQRPAQFGPATGIL